MSDLQLSLLVIGAVVIAGVCFFNWWQARKLRQRLEDAFDGSQRNDALLGESSATISLAGANERVEPQIGGDGVADSPKEKTSTDTPHVGQLPSAMAGIDETIDCVATLISDQQLDHEIVAELMSGIAACGKSWRAAGFNAGSGNWEEINRAAAGHYSELRLALQIVNRAGPISAVQLGAFCDAINAAAAKTSAQAQLPDAEATLHRAHELDRFCADVDVAIGVNVIAPEDGAFRGSLFRGLVESQGFMLEHDGVFHLEDENSSTILTIGNHNPSEPFLAETISSLTTRGLTLLLDVPRVGDGEKALERMLEIGKGLAVTLKGRLVDDNHASLTIAGMDQIRRQLHDIHFAMNARDIAPGSPRALRLFS